VASHRRSCYIPHCIRQSGEQVRWRHGMQLCVAILSRGSEQTALEGYAESGKAWVKNCSLERAKVWLYRVGGRQSGSRLLYASLGTSAARHAAVKPLLLHLVLYGIATTGSGNGNGNGNGPCTTAITQASQRATSECSARSTRYNITSSSFLLTPRAPAEEGGKGQLSPAQPNASALNQSFQETPTVPGCEPPNM